jgi:TonB family protein
MPKTAGHEYFTNRQLPTVNRQLFSGKTFPFCRAPSSHQKQKAMNLLIYIIKTIFISGLLLVYYLFFLRNRFFHGFNRFYLLAIPPLAFLLPAFQIRIPGIWNQESSGSAIRLLGVGRGTLEEVVTVYANRNTSVWFSREFILPLIWTIITVFLLIRFYRSVRYLIRLRKNKDHLTLPEADVYFVKEEGTPFSFFRSIFWNQDTEINSPSSRQILRHELFHVRQKHSLDLFVIECLSILCWFNPFFYYLRREIKAIHEFDADRYAAEESSSFEYASLLLYRSTGKPLPLTNPFFKNQIKRRITMITKNNNNKKLALNRILILPLIAVVAGLFSFKMQNHFFPSSKNIRVVIDAGHGGSFNGATSNGLLEKNINLEIARKIQSLAREYNVEVIMSRETDVTPGSNELRESLEYIAALPKNKNADLFISIHANATETALQGKQQTAKSGFEIYVPRNSSEVYNGSVKLGSVITEAIKPDYTIEPELKQTQGDGGNILILKKATVPALLIECGYIDNPSDLKYLQDEKNQEKIARDILAGIQRYGRMGNGADTSRLPEIVVDNVVDNTTRSEIKTDNQSLAEIVNDSTAPYKKVEVEAVFPGGQDAWTQYLMKNVNYPSAAEKKGIQGTVVVEFTVNVNGTISAVHAISGPEPLRSESVRVIKESGKWTPAKDQGKIVASYKKQPINFALQQK